MAATKAGRAKTGAGKSAAGKSAAPKEDPAAIPPVAAAESGAGGEKLSALAAAAKVLAADGTAMTCRQLVAVMAVRGDWRSPGGKSPHATLHAAISTEIKTKGAAARFRKTAPGRFAAAGAPGTLPPATGRPRAAGRKRAAGAGARTVPAAG